MADEKRFTEHDLRMAERVTAVETQLVVVTDKVDDHRKHNDKRLDELLMLLQKPESTTQVVLKPEAPIQVVLKWAGANWKLLLILAGVLGGSTTLAKALALLN